MTQSGSGPSVEFAPSESLLESLEPQPYFAVWQFVEGYFAFMGFPHEDQILSFLMVATSETVAKGLRDEDAAQNSRGPDAYEIRKLTLADACEAARSRPLPILYPGMGPSYLVGGLAVFQDLSGTCEFIRL